MLALRRRLRLGLRLARVRQQDLPLEKARARATGEQERKQERGPAQVGARFGVSAWEKRSHDVLQSNLGDLSARGDFDLLRPGRFDRGPVPDIDISANPDGTSLQIPRFDPGSYE